MDKRSTWQPGRRPSAFGGGHFTVATGLSTVIKRKRRLSWYVTETGVGEEENIRPVVGPDDRRFGWVGIYSDGVCGRGGPVSHGGYALSVPASGVSSESVG